MARHRYLPFLICMLVRLDAAELKPETVTAFDRYVKLTEEGFAKNQGFENFLWLDHHPTEKTMVWLQQSVVTPMRTLDHGAQIEVPGGVIQHWMGAAYLENATLEKVRDVVLSYNDYKTFFKQEVMDSRQIKRDGEQFDAFVRFYKKQVSAVVLNVNLTARYTLIDPTRLYIASHSTHIGEVEHPKNKKKLDQERDPEDAAGYLWRLNMYWRIFQADNGAYVELEVLSLAREEGGRLNPSRFLTGFQSFPHDLTQDMMDSLQQIFPHHR